MHVVHVAEGRVTKVTGKMKAQPICLLAVYAPAQRGDRPKFLDQLSELPQPQGSLVIAAGDFNCTLQPEDATGPDRHLTAGRRQLEQWVENWGLQDAWRCAQHIDDGDEGWTKYTAAGHASRIDHVYLSRSHSSLITRAATLAMATSDHRAVLVKVGDRGGRGRWRLNPALLKQPQLCSLVAETLRLHLDDVATGRSTLGDAWVAFKDGSAAHCRDMAKALSRRRTADMRRAQAAIRAARSPEERVAAELCVQQQEAFQRQGELARRGIAKMSGDKPTREFFRRMASPSTKRDIQALTLPNNEVSSDPATILDALVKYWKGVYGSDLPAEMISPEREAAIIASLGRLTTRLTPQQRETLSAPYSDEELHAALKSLPVGSSPGNDGLSLSFYLEFWPMLGGPLTSLLNATLDGRRLPVDLLAARVIPFPKTTDTAPRASQFRPISLLGTDYKIMSKAVTRRILKVMPSLCHPTQTGFIPGRSILHNVSSNRDCIEFHRDKPSSSVIAFLDFEKAFDRVSWHFRDRVMAKMGFPEELMCVISAFYHDAPIQLEVNGQLSAPFRATRGTRQGCPLSPCLFSLYAEPLGGLLRALATGPAPTGIPLPPTRRLGAPTHLAGCQYADDTTVYCNSPASLERVLQAVPTEFCMASGAQLNVDKSRVLLVGNHAGPLPTSIAGIPVLDPDEVISSLGAKYSGSLPLPRHIPGVVASMDRNLEWWRQHCASLHSRARLANALLSSRLWYHMQFEPVDEQDLQRASEKVWRCIWGTGSDGKAKKGMVAKDRACAAITLGGLAVIEPSVMHTALKSRIVNLALSARGEWWTLFSEALVEQAAGTGPGTGFDGLAEPAEREAIASRADPFWRQALQCWSKLQLTQQGSTPSEAIPPALLVQRAMRTATSAQELSELQAIAREGKQYLSDFYDPRQRRMCRPPRVLTSVPAVQRRNAALNHIVSCISAAEVAALAAAAPPPVQQFCRVREQPTIVYVLGPAPLQASALPCCCKRPEPLIVKRVRRTAVVGPPVLPAEHSPWSSRMCACSLSPLLLRAETRELIGEAEITGLRARRLQNAKAKLECKSTVSEMRLYFCALHRPGSSHRPSCEAAWSEGGELGGTKSDWELVWKAISSANLASYARSLLWRIAHQRLPLLSQGWVQAHNGQDAMCLLCGDAEETAAHLFFTCTHAQSLWNILTPLAAKLGIGNHTSLTSRLTGLLGSFDSDRLRALLPAGERAAPAAKIRKVALRSWTEMRALVLPAIWQARCDILHGRSTSVTVSMRLAEGKVRAGLRYLVYLHLPHLSPWCLEPALEAKQEKKLPQFIWQQLQPLILRRRAPASSH